MSGWERTLRIMLPPINGVNAHITKPVGGYHAFRNGKGSSPHVGVDVNYIGGQQSQINKDKPIVGAPVSGVIRYIDYADKLGAVSILADDGTVHEILHLSERLVQPGVMPDGSPIRVNA